MRLFSFLGSILFVSIATLCSTMMLWISGRRPRAWLIIITIAGGSLLTAVLKIGFHRQRPQPFFDTPLPDSYSFPSGHALVPFCFYGAAAALSMTKEKRRWVRTAIWTATVVLILAIGISRVYLGVHYPSDVLAGYLAALVWVLGVATSYRQISTRARSTNKQSSQK